VITDQVELRVITSPGKAGLGSAQSRLRGEALFFSGLLGLFIVSVTVWAALMVSVPALWHEWTSVVITSDSMAPSIRRGDIVITAPAGVDVFGPGSVIVFQDPTGGLLTHRVVAVNDDGSYSTQGDANGQPDSTPVHPSRVIGEGRFLVPLFGLPLVWAQQGSWLLLVVWAGATVSSALLSRYAFLDPRGLSVQ
jgi:signal peptidase I